MKKLYLYMDGVLMDFDAGLAKRGLVNNKTFIHIPKVQWTAEQRKLFNAVCAVMNDPYFWFDLDPMPDAKELWEFCTESGLDFEILTAIPPKKLNPITEDIKCSKLDAIANFFDLDFPLSRVRFCQRAEKKLLAHSHAVLVDDMIGNCEEWTKEGGIAILHTSAKDSIAALGALLG